MAVGHLNMNNHPQMINNKVFCVGFVLLFISSSNGNYEEAGPYYTVMRGYREVGFENTSFSSEDDQQDLLIFNHDATFRSKSYMGNTYLDLTRFMRAKLYARGIRQAKVKLLKNVSSFSGFFEVSNGGHMFFWYFRPPTKHLIRDRKTPLIVWVQGAMALPGEFAALRQNGPINLKPDGKVTFNKYSWTEAAHLVYFDSPVGVGYSFSSKQNYPTNQRAIATDLYSALGQFCDLFRLAHRPLFIAGQGYAGKTIAALGAMMHKRKGEKKFNLRGVAIGNGLIDPPNMLEYGKLLYQLGFIDTLQREEFRGARKEVQSLLRKRKFEDAMKVYCEYFEHNLDQNNTRTAVFEEAIGRTSKYNFTMVKKGFHEGTLLERFLNDNITQGALHTTGIPFVRSNLDIMKALWPELLKTQVRHFKAVLGNYRVLLYNGQMSIKNAYPLVMNYLQRIKWKGAANFRDAERKQWIVDNEVAGYWKTGGGLTEVLVRNAGMHVSKDQPKWAQRMINKFIYEQSMND